MVFSLLVAVDPVSRWKPPAVGGFFGERAGRRCFSAQG